VSPTLFFLRFGIGNLQTVSAGGAASGGLMNSGPGARKVEAGQPRLAWAGRGLACIFPAASEVPAGWGNDISSTAVPRLHPGAAVTGA
jgi:hypothetical protein